MKTLHGQFIVAVAVCHATFLGGTAWAEVTYEPVLGTFALTDATYQACCWYESTPCIDPSFIGLAWGGPGGTFSSMRGDISGTLQELGVLIDGARLNGLTLPVASYFSYGIEARGVPYCSEIVDCGPWPACRLDWTIGSHTGSFNDIAGWGDTFLNTPVLESVGGLPFSFTFCSKDAIWGMGCDWSGSSDRRWILHAPAAIRGHQFASGDSAPFEFSGTGIILDLQDSPGGAVGATSVVGTPPFTVPQILFIPRYWEANTDMPANSFLADLRIGFSPSEIPAGIPEEDLTLWRYDHVCRGWELLPAVVDTVNHDVSATGLQELGMFILGGSAGEPIGSTTVTVDTNGLAWQALPDATSYDVIRGDLEMLTATGGDFAAAVTECVMNDTAALTVPYAGEPEVGAGFWFLVRGLNATGNGTYDSFCGQAAPRDSEIAASAASCP